MIPAAHLNETLKRMLPVMAHTSGARLSQALQTPYLVFKDSDHKGISRAELCQMGLTDDFGLVRTPFPIFRFCIEDYKGRVVYGCAQRQDDNLQMVAFHRYDGKLGPVAWGLTFKRYSEDGALECDGRMFDTCTSADVTDAVKRSEELRGASLPQKDQLSPAEARAWIPRIQGMMRTHEKAREVLRAEIGVIEHAEGLGASGAPEGASTFVALYHSLMLLCYEYLVPSNFVARVIPATQGKSVEWLKAREHYTVIHRHHSANNAALKEGETVSSAGHQQRLAHSRRAHTKLLTHPKWKYKRGQRVFVRASWVGPKEWKDTAGQTYQILTPVAA